MVDMVFYVDEIVQVLHDRYGEPGKPLLFLLYGLNTDSGNFSKPAVLKVQTSTCSITFTLSLFLSEMMYQIMMSIISLSFCCLFCSRLIQIFETFIVNILYRVFVSSIY